MAERRGRTRSAEWCEGCTLADARAGDCMLVTSVNDPDARVTALRFGMAEGACVHCVARIPAGPIVLRSGRQEIAVGRELARRISVRPHVAGSATPPVGLPAATTREADADTAREAVE
jgi:Fe2+ transport system protein FeoA